MGGEPYWVVPNARVPIPHRLRYAAEVVNAMKAVAKRPKAPSFAARRIFRMAMEQQRRRTLKRWMGNIR